MSQQSRKEPTAEAASPTGERSGGPAEPTSWVGKTLDGRYRIDSPLGHGGVGAVYRATQLKLERPVAIKILHEGLHPSFAARFEREAMALAALRHPNIVSVTDYGVDRPPQTEDRTSQLQDTPYIVMELLEGETLHYRLTHGPLPPERMFVLARELLRALSFVHEQGLVHRDLKPGNVFLEKLPHDEVRLRLLDFGLAKYVQGSRASGDDTDFVTRQGDIVGTPAYMAPEQIAGDVVDARTDTYSVGIVLFQMLAGRTPYEGPAVELLRSHLAAPVPTLKQRLMTPGVTPRPELEAFFARALAKARDERFQTCTEMLSALEVIEQPWLVEGGPDAEHDPASAPTARPPARDSLNPTMLHVRNEAVEPSGPSTGVMVRRIKVMVPIAFGVFVVLMGAALLLIRPSSERETADVIRPAPAQEQHVHSQARALGEAASARAYIAARQQKEALAAKTATPSPAPAAPAAAAPTAADAIAKPKRVPARDPWKEGVPRALAPHRKAARADDRGNERMFSALRKYNKDNPTDARGHLVLAMLYRNRKWRADALKQYQIIQDIDPGARGAPEMLPELMQLYAQDGKASSEAGALIETVYGPEALPAIDRAILALKKQDLPDVLARIQEMRARIKAQQ